MRESAALPSWKDGPAKAAILDFVRSVTVPGEGFVPPADRIVTFDNDGTLWCEKPLYVRETPGGVKGRHSSGGVGPGTRTAGHRRGGGRRGVRRPT